MHAGAYGDVRVVLAEPNAVVRHGLKSALATHGFRRMFDTDRFGPAYEELHSNEVDLLITSSELFGGDIAQLIGEIRHMKVGRNPFLCVIVIITSPSVEKVRHFAAAGADDAIAAPVTAGHLLSRIDGLATSRKPFVIINGYVGPDRRSQQRAEGSTAPLIEAPNLLKLRIAGKDGDYLHTVHAAVQKLEAALAAAKHKG
jgi:DNA-binding response OmpR family regulator